MGCRIDTAHVGPPRAGAGMLNDADLVAFVATTDLTRARAFYADVVGLTLTEDTPFVCVFEANGESSVRVRRSVRHTRALHRAR